MPKFNIARAETNIVTYEIEGNSLADAICKLLDGEDATEVASTFYGDNEDLGIDVRELPSDVVKELRELGRLGNGETQLPIIMGAASAPEMPTPTWMY